LNSSALLWLLVWAFGKLFVNSSSRLAAVSNASPPQSLEGIVVPSKSKGRSCSYKAQVMLYFSLTMFGCLIYMFLLPNTLTKMQPSFTIHGFKSRLLLGLFLLGLEGCLSCSLKLIFIGMPHFMSMHYIRVVQVWYTKNYFAVGIDRSFLPGVVLAICYEFIMSGLIQICMMISFGNLLVQ